ncbi:MAG: hypothetical protein GIKADHBN_00252 [Phycisphaerales bacterium]|nr:hypothetical protein [Phycisphaerales bacterium]
MMKSLSKSFRRVNCVLMRSTKLKISSRAFMSPQLDVTIDSRRSDLLSLVPPSFARTKMSRTRS